MNWLKPVWHKHPAVRSDGDLTLGERAADKLRATMGSWGFVFGFIFFMAIWGTVNSYIADMIVGGKPFDPYPWVLLNLGLSMMAGLQGAILLISAKRADQISSELALHDFDVNKASLKYHTHLAAAVISMCEHLNVELPEEVMQALSHPDKIPVPPVMLD